MFFAVNYREGQPFVLQQNSEFCIKGCFVVLWADFGMFVHAANKRQIENPM